VGRAADRPAAAADRSAPLSRLRVGLIGCGAVATTAHIPAWRECADVAELVAVADPTESSLEGGRALAGIDAENAHRDPFELIARDDIDAVDVCSPPSLRREVLLEAARRGKHILCEKPITTVPADGAAAVEAAAAAGSAFGMVHSYARFRQIEAAQRVVDSGEIGEIRSVVVNFLGIPPGLTGTAGYAPRWRHNAAQAGGGVLMNIIHGVYLAEGLLGRRFERASAFIDNSDPASNVEDVALCRFEANGGAALVNIGTGIGADGFDIVGTKGRVTIVYAFDGSGPWSSFDRVLVTTATGTRTELEAEQTAGYSLEGSGYTFVGVMRDFVDAARTGRAPRASGADGLRILEAAMAAYGSAATGCAVALPLDREGPLFAKGVLGVNDLELPEWSPVRRLGLYGS
jgi:predicted dehydrogenase